MPASLIRPMRSANSGIGQVNWTVHHLGSSWQEQLQIGHRAALPAHERQCQCSTPSFSAPTSRGKLTFRTPGSLSRSLTITKSPSSSMT
eukprot:362403-Hanusia_phi.AAC.1